MRKPFVITIDKDVPIPGEDSIYASHAEKLKSMQPGDSFFIPGAQACDVAGLQAYADTLEIPLTPVQLLQDEIYLTAGVRIWRSYSTISEFVDRKVEQVAAALGIKKEEPTGDVKKGKAKALTAALDNIEKTFGSSRGARYWHHPESCCVFAVAGDEPDPVTDGLLEKINLDEYLRLSGEYNKAAQVQKVLDTPENARWIGVNHESWWKLKTGKMVEATYEQYEQLQKDKTATRVAYSDYRLWKERQDEEL